MRQFVSVNYTVEHIYLNGSGSVRHPQPIEKDRDGSDELAGADTSLSAELRNLRGGAPEVMKAFSSIAQAALSQGALDPKTKELIALGIAIAIRCDDCIAFHVKAAIERGATREEVLETLGMAIYMGAGPSAMHASHALSAYTQFAVTRTRADAA